MRAAWVLGIGIGAAIVSGCHATPVPLSPPGGLAPALQAASRAGQMAHFAVDSQVLDYTADAVIKAVAAVKQAVGSNAKALKGSQVIVSLYQVAAGGTLRAYEVEGDFTGLAEQAGATKADARQRLAQAVVHLPYPVNDVTGTFAAVPTGEKAGATVTYYLKVTANGPMASMGRREQLAETFISNYGKNFTAPVR